MIHQSSLASPDMLGEYGNQATKLNQERTMGNEIYPQESDFVRLQTGEHSCFEEQYMLDRQITNLTDA
jgi:hypothetical protein